MGNCVGAVGAMAAVKNILRRGFVGGRAQAPRNQSVSRKGLVTTLSLLKPTLFQQFVVRDDFPANHVTGLGLRQFQSAGMRLRDVTLGRLWQSLDALF